MEPIVEIKGLTKDYEKGFWKKKQIRALDDLNLEVESGQIFGFLGGNGAGKTTTIKLLMGLIFPTNGSARILGKDIADVSMHARIGYCPESPYFYDYLKASELMDYFGRLFGLDASTRKTRTAELADPGWTRRKRLEPAVAEVLKRNAAAGRPGAEPGQRSGNRVSRRTDERSRSDRPTAGSRVDRRTAK